MPRVWQFVALGCTVTKSEGSGLAADATRIFVDPWSPLYGTAYLVDEDAEEANAADLIHEEGFGFVAPPPPREAIALAFVDGVRRQEAALSQWVNGAPVAGIAGAYGVGAVVVDPGATPAFAHEEVARLVIWSAGRSGDLPTVAGGWAWTTDATPETGPTAPLRRLQERMRAAEARLAARLAADGRLVVTDGTLWLLTAHDVRNVVGYVKTHHRRLLPEAEAARLADLPPRIRTTLFRLDRRYACYLRLSERRPHHAPWAGIVRLEFSGALPLEEVRALADQLAAVLPDHAGVAHVDPRAPQNLQPIGALEARLRHLLGDPGLAERAVRDVVGAMSR